MKRGCIILLLICLLCDIAFGQDLDSDIGDSVSFSRSQFIDDNFDSDTTLTVFQERARHIFGSMFGTSKELSDADSIVKMFDRSPSFGIYKDNYFTVGTEMFSEKTKWNSDAKFQVSIRHRLTNSTLPFKTFVFLTYTQKAFWDVFQESLPFRDLNFNPSVGIGKFLVHKNRYLGSFMFHIEHESNGKDGDASRSWNKIAFDAMLIFRDRWSLQTKIWIPIVDDDNNRDIVSYSGYATTVFSYSSPKRKYNASCIITKRAGRFFEANVALNFSVRLFDNENQHLFVEYYDGYGESMLEYKQYRQRIRMGMVIKPNFYSIF